MSNGTERRADLERNIDGLQTKIAELQEFREFLKGDRSFEKSAFTPARLRELARRYNLTAEDLADEAALEKIDLEIRIRERRLRRAREELAALPVSVPFTKRILGALEALAIIIIAVLAGVAAFAASALKSLTSIMRPLLVFLFILAVPAIALWVIWLSLKGDDTLAQKSCETYLQEKQAAGELSEGFNDCVTVYFATPRAAVKDTRSVTKATGQEQENAYQLVRRFKKTQEKDKILYWGRAEVTVPKREPLKSGEVTNFRARLREGQGRSQTRVTILTVGAGGEFNAAKNRYFEELSTDINAADRKVLFFVHGYQVKFEEALKLSARLSFDLNLKNPQAYLPADDQQRSIAYSFGQPFLFSWPNDESLLGFGTDRDRNAPAAAPFLAKALAAVITSSTGPGEQTEKELEINLIAHSMGNRVLLESLHDLASDSSLRGRKFKLRIIHAAAEPGQKLYNDKVDEFERSLADDIQRSVTIYSDADDFALASAEALASVEAFGRAPVVGKHGNWDDWNKTKPFVYKGEGSSHFTTIDATGFKTDWNHSYFNESPTVVADIACAFRDVSPSERMLIAQPTKNPEWWRMSDRAIEKRDECKVTALPGIAPCEQYIRALKWPLIGESLAEWLVPGGGEKCTRPPVNICDPKNKSRPDWCPDGKVWPESKFFDVSFKAGKPSLGKGDAGEKFETERLQNWYNAAKGDEQIKSIVILVYAKDEVLAQERFKTVKEILVGQGADETKIERSTTETLSAGDSGKVTVSFESRVPSKAPEDLR